MMRAPFGTALAACILASPLLTSIPSLAAIPQEDEDSVAPLPAEPVFLFAPEAVAAAIDAVRQRPGFSGLAVDWGAIAAFYRETGGRALFVTPGGFSVLGAALVERLPRAVAAGMKISADLLRAAANLAPPRDAAEGLASEAMLAVLLAGQSVDTATPLGREAPPGSSLLTRAAQAEEGGGEAARAFIAWQFPSYYRFWSLLPEAAAYAEYARGGGWPAIDSGKKLEPGDRDPRLAAIRARLAVTGELAAEAVDLAADPQLYDTALVEAVKHFQERHGLDADGIIGRRSLEEMNVDAATRLRQILLNLERMRSEDMPARYLLVNIPAQEARLIDSGRVIFRDRTIVGRIDRQTPTLASVIRAIKFNPDWTTPARIAAIDEVERERAEPGFLAGHGFTIYDADGGEVDPGSIDWQAAGPGNFPYTLRQAPGPENALGAVKLDFENVHSVYIHGTPARSLFARQDRYFSSGCMRLETPLDLAALLLEADPAWTRRRIDAIVADGETVQVPLKSPLPVRVVYMTVWVDEEGVLQFRKDMYKRDELPALPDGWVAPQAIAASQAQAGAESDGD